MRTEWKLSNGKTMIVGPTTEEMMVVVTKNPGITMDEIHKLNFRSIFSALENLKDLDKIFEQNGRYYPNN